MLIFDSFRSQRGAEAFASQIALEFPSRTAQVFASAEEAMRADPIPVVLQAPVVHVSRNYEFSDSDLREESAIRLLARRFCGVFVGT